MHEGFRERGRNRKGSGACRKKIKRKEIVRYEKNKDMEMRLCIALRNAQYFVWQTRGALCEV
jgi:hypothetical protein